MMRNALLLILLVLAVGLAGCSDDDPVQVKKPCDPCPPAFRTLDTRDNLLYNLELAYTLRNFEEYRKLPDSSGSFTFYFGQDDLNQGTVTSSQWGVGAELASTQALFDRNPPQGEPRADDVVLDLTYAEGEDEWAPFVPSTHPLEIWYSKIVEYDLSVRIGVTTYAQNKRVFAEFTARFTEVAGDSLWQIVTWRDDVPPQIAITRNTQGTADIGSVTWGLMKELFSGGSGSASEVHP
jgi:hypothetical protein